MRKIGYNKYKEPERKVDLTIKQLDDLLLLEFKHGAAWGTLKMCKPEQGKRYREEYDAARDKAEVLRKDLAIDE